MGALLEAIHRTVARRAVVAAELAELDKELEKAREWLTARPAEILAKMPKPQGGAR